MFKSLSLATSFLEDEVLMIGLLLCFFFSFTKLVLGRPVTQKPNQGKFLLLARPAFYSYQKMIRSLSAFINHVLNSILGNVGHQRSRSREGEGVSFKTSSHMNLWNAGKHSRLMSSVTVPERDLFLQQQ